VVIVESEKRRGRGPAVVPRRLGKARHRVRHTSYLSEQELDFTNGEVSFKMRQIMLHVWGLMIIFARAAAADDSMASSGLVSDDICASIATPSDTSYWDAITSCGPCVRKGCGYCLSTLQCMGGDERGPRAGAMPCPSWVYSDESACPTVPECGSLLTCGDCATHEMCAWCSNVQKCMTIEETFYSDCRGVVFEPPCPVSLTPGTKNENKIKKNTPTCINATRAVAHLLDTCVCASLSPAQKTPLSETFWFLLTRISEAARCGPELPSGT